MINQAHILQYNETSILIRFEEKIDVGLLKYLLQLKNDIVQNRHKQVLQVISTYDSLLIIYKFTINNFYETKLEILNQISKVKVKHKMDSAIKKIPVCYDKELGWDLEILSDDLGLPISEIIERHSAEIYTVYFIGFLPGFPYLGGLNSSLFHRRRSQPRSQIPAGSVGIADQQTGIYPIDSPGGWQIIGRSPIQLFDKNYSTQSCYLQAGDQIQFESISKDEFEYLQLQFKDKNR